MTLFSVLASIYSTFVVAIVGPTVRVRPVVVTPVVANSATADVSGEGVTEEITLPDVELALIRFSRRKIGSRWFPSPHDLEEAIVFHSSDAVGPGDVMGYDAIYDLLIPTLSIVWMDGSSSLEPLINLQSIGNGVDRAISLMTASDWRKYWGPLIRLVPIAIVGFELEGRDGLLLIIQRSQKVFCRIRHLRFGRCRNL